MKKFLYVTITILLISGTLFSTTHQPKPCCSKWQSSKYQPKPEDHKYQPKPDDSKYQPKPDDHKYQPKPGSKHQPHPQ